MFIRAGITAKIITSTILIICSDFFIFVTPMFLNSVEKEDNRTAIIDLGQNVATLVIGIGERNIVLADRLHRVGGTEIKYLLFTIMHSFVAAAANLS